MKEVKESPVTKRGPGRPRKVTVSGNTTVVTKRRVVSRKRPVQVITPVEVKPVEVKPYVPIIKITSSGTGWQVAITKEGQKYDSTFGLINQSPTNNCQLFCWGAFNNVMSAYRNQPELFTRICKEVSTRMGKPLMLVDFNSTWVTEFKKLVPASSIILDVPYKSSNGSQMSIIIFRPGFNI